MKIGFIGLGTMGEGMATNLRKGGYELIVHDIRAEAAKPHLAAGASWQVRLALVLALAVGHAAMYAPQGAFFSELFGARVRYSGASLGAQLSSVLAGGMAPIIATTLLEYGYGRGALALYLMGMAAITIVAVAVAAETVRHDIDRAD